MEIFLRVSKIDPMFHVGLLLLLHAVVGNPSLTANQISPTDPKIRYVGRFDNRDAAGPRCAWPASSVEITFQGSSLKATIKDTGQDSLEVTVDGTQTKTLKLQQTAAEYDIASDLSGARHTAKLVKRTETFVGTVQFLGFQVQGKLLNPSTPNRILEVIGDSISCGYGNEGKAKEEHFAPNTENADKTYGAIASRALNADFVDIAWSGRTMWPTNSIPEIYNLALAADPTSTWDLKQQTPNAIVINLATNDFGKAIPDEKSWTEAYAAFIGRLRQRAPKARIYCASGPMMSDNWPPKVKALSTLKAYLQDIVNLRASVGDKNIAIINFEVQNEARDGIGSDWHPNVKTHHNMADLLTKTLHSDLGW